MAIAALELRTRSQMGYLIGAEVAELSGLWTELGSLSPRAPRPTTVGLPQATESRPVDTTRGNPLALVWRGLVHLGRLATTAVLGLSVTIATLIVATLATGHQFETVVTGSMQPVIPIGSLVVMQRVTTNELRVGDVIAFTEPCRPTRVIVHRIVQASDNAAGQVIIHTKGDANPGPDNWPVNCADPGATSALVRDGAASADRAIYVIPGVGTALDLGRRVALLMLLVVGGMMVLWVGAREVRRALCSPPYRASRDVT